MATPIKLNLPDEYSAYIRALADQLDSSGVITGNGETAVLVAALNLLNEFMQKIGSTSQQERVWRLQVLADLSKAVKPLSED